MKKIKIREGRREIRSIFKKDNVTGNTKTVRTRIIAVIALVFRAITKKSAHRRTRRKFVSLKGR